MLSHDWLLCASIAAVAFAAGVALTLIVIGR